MLNPSPASPRLERLLSAQECRVGTLLLLNRIFGEEAPQLPVVQALHEEAAIHQVRLEGLVFSEPVGLGESKTSQKQERG